MIRLYPDSHEVLLTASDITKLEDEHGRMTAEIAEIEARREQLETRRAQIVTRLAKIRELLTELGLAGRVSGPTSSSASGATEAREPSAREEEEEEEEASSSRVERGKKRELRGLWAPQVLKLLRAGPYESLTSAELRRAVEAGPLGDALKVSDKGYYHAVRRLALRGSIAKSHGRIFTINGLKRYKSDVASGRQSVEFGPPTVNARQSPMADAIVAFVGKSKHGVFAGHVVDHLLTDERFAGSVGRNRSAAYNVLARLVSRGQLVRIGGGNYALPPKNKAPSA